MHTIEKYSPAIEAKLLLDAAELVAAGHAKREFATDRAGRPIAVEHQDAACFCLFGALYRVVGLEGAAALEVTCLGDELHHAGKVIGLINDDLPFLTSWNDSPDTTGAHVAGLMAYVAWTKGATL